MRALEVEIANLISADPLWSKLDEAFTSIKGVADRTVARLMAESPEIGLISNKAIAKFVGIAPLADDSGNSEGTRSIRGGRSTVREILFVVADIARCYDPKLEAFRDRLLHKGKKKVVRIALAHKLLVWLNAKLSRWRRKARTPRIGGTAPPAATISNSKSILTRQTVAHAEPMTQRSETPHSLL
jgi:transposase